MDEYKVVILGCGGVGKSALTSQMISNVFPETYDPTIEDFYRREISVDGHPSVLDILDTAGNEQFSSMRDMYVKLNHGFLLVYPLTDKKTLKELEPIRNQIVRLKGTEDVPMIVVGNKYDLSDRRKVGFGEGQMLADKWNCRFYETSAKTRYNVNEIFIDIVELIDDCTKEAEEKKILCCNGCECCRKHCTRCTIS